MICINGKQVALIGTTNFFVLSDVEKRFLQIFDGFSIEKIGECHPEKIQEYREAGKILLFHSGLGIATSPTEDILKEVAYAQEIGAQAYSLAGGFTCSKVKKHQYGYSLPAKDAKRFDFEEFLKRGKVNVEAIKENFPEIIIAFENLDYWMGGAYECCHAWQIIEMIKCWDVSLLLDIGHMQVSAHKLITSARSQSPAMNLKVSTIRYFEEILCALQEKIIWAHLHKAGITRKGEAYDAHGFPADLEFKILELLPNLEYITLEHPHNIAAITTRAVDDLKDFLEERNFFEKKWKWLS